MEVKGADLQQDVRTVVNCHDEGSNADVIWNPREAQQGERGCVMDHLFLKVLQASPSSQFYKDKLLFLYSEIRQQTHLPLHVKRQAEEQGNVEAHLQRVVPVLRWQHGLRGHGTFRWLKRWTPNTSSRETNTYLFWESCPHLPQVIQPRFLWANTGKTVTE